MLFVDNNKRCFGFLACGGGFWIILIDCFASLTVQARFYRIESKGLYVNSWSRAKHEMPKGTQLAEFLLGCQRINESLTGIRDVSGFIKYSMLVGDMVFAKTFIIVVFSEPIDVLTVSSASNEVFAIWGQFLCIC